MSNFDITYVQSKFDEWIAAANTVKLTARKSYRNIRNYIAKRQQILTPEDCEALIAISGKIEIHIDREINVYLDDYIMRIDQATQCGTAEMDNFIATLLYEDNESDTSIEQYVPKKQLKLETPLENNSDAIDEKPKSTGQVDENDVIEEITTNEYRFPEKYFPSY